MAAPYRFERVIVWQRRACPLIQAGISLCPAAEEMGIAATTFRLRDLREPAVGSNRPVLWSELCYCGLALPR